MDATDIVSIIAVLSVSAISLTTVFAISRAFRRSDQPASNAPAAADVTKEASQLLTAPLPVNSPIRQMRKIDRCDPITGKCIETYDNIHAVVEAGYSRSSVANALVGTQMEAVGFHWRYSEERYRRKQLQRMLSRTTESQLQLPRRVEQVPEQVAPVQSRPLNTVETAQPTHQAKRARRVRRNAKPVEAFDLETGKVLFWYPSIADAQRDGYSGIWPVLYGYTKSHQGYG